MTQVDLVRGDKNYYLQFHLRDVEDNIIDLTEGTIVPRLKMQKYGSSLLFLDKEGEIVNGELGICRFKIEDELLSEAGDFVAEVEINWLDRAVTLTATGIYVHITKDLPRV